MSATPEPRPLPFLIGLAIIGGLFLLWAVYLGVGCSPESNRPLIPTLDWRKPVEAPTIVSVRTWPTSATRSIARINAISKLVEALEPLFEEQTRLIDDWNSWIGTEDQETASPKRSREILSGFRDRHHYLHVKVSAVDWPRDCRPIREKWLQSLEAEIAACDAYMSSDPSDSAAYDRASIALERANRLRREVRDEIDDLIGETWGDK